MKAKTRPLRHPARRAAKPERKSRGKPIQQYKPRDKLRNSIEVMFDRLKGWRKVATRVDRCPEVFLSVIALAAIVMFWR